MRSLSLSCSLTDPRASIPWLLACVLLAACTEIRTVETRTQVTLRIQAEDESLLAQMTHLHVALRRKDADWVPASSATLSRARIEFPLDIPIFPSSDDAIDKPFEVVVDALADGVRISQSRVIAAYARNTLRILPLALYACSHADGSACASDDCHGETCLTCGAGGTCEPVSITDPEQLEVGALDGGSEPGDAAPRAEAEAGQPAPGRSDASTQQNRSDASTLPSRNDAGAVNACQRSTEICDAVDNDCDGKADNGPDMSCVRDERAACTFSNGSCSVTGAHQCSAICGWGSCMPPAEAACDRKDDNCNGSIDEGMLAFAAGLPLTGYEGQLSDTSLAHAPASSAAAGGFFGLYLYPVAGKGALKGVRIAADGKLIGIPISIDSDVGARAKVAWSGSSWVVVYITAATNPLASSVVSVTVDPSSGALGSKRVLSSAGDAGELSVAGTNPPLAVWTSNGGIFGASLAAGAAVVTLSPSTTVATSDRFFRLAFNVIEDGKSWVLWAGAMKSETATTNSYANYYLSVDSSLRVLTNKLLLRDAEYQPPDSVVYVPELQKLVGDIYPNKRASHALDGSGFAIAGTGGGTLFSDVNGYMELSQGALIRYSLAGERVETYVPDVDFYFADFAGSYAAVPLGADATARYAVLGGYKGGLKIFFLGCKSTVR
jgi:hypothetical protein